MKTNRLISLHGLVYLLLLPPVAQAARPTTISYSSTVIYTPAQRRLDNQLHQAQLRELATIVLENLFSFQPASYKRKWKECEALLAPAARPTGLAVANGLIALIADQAADGAYTTVKSLDITFTNPNLGEPYRLVAQLTMSIYRPLAAVNNDVRLHEKYFTLTLTCNHCLCTAQNPYGLQITHMDVVANEVPTPTLDEK